MGGKRQGASETNTQGVSKGGGAAICKMVLQILKATFRAHISIL